MGTSNRANYVAYPIQIYEYQVEGELPVLVDTIHSCMCNKFDLLYTYNSFTDSCQCA